VCCGPYPTLELPLLRLKENEGNQQSTGVSGMGIRRGKMGNAHTWPVSNYMLRGK